MKNLLMLLFTMLISMSYGQSIMTDNEIMDEIDYFDMSKNLDDIEGIWSLAVTRTLTYDGNTYTETEEKYSEWMISRQGSKYVVRPVNDYPTEAFTASFQKVSKNEYIYKCTFHNPHWGVTTHASIVDGYMIQYGYHADDVYLKKVYGNDYRSDMTLHWAFTWYKIYPKVIKI